MEDLTRYLQNPDDFLSEIRRASVYLTNKHGVLKDSLRMLKTLPTLKYSLKWSVEDDRQIDENEQEINDFLRDIDVVKFIRDGMYEVGLLGTVVMVLRSRKYIQFLDVDEVVIRMQRNGKWVVEYDLEALEEIRDLDEKVNKIESLPDEVTLNKYNEYKNKKDDSIRYVELSNTEVVSMDALRNSPYGLPFHLGAWHSILQREMIDDVERAISERMLTQIIILQAGYFDKEGNRPVTDDVVDIYYKGVERVLRAKETTARNSRAGANSTGLISLPSFLDLDSLKIDSEMFDKDLYDKLNDAVYSNLGISRAMIFGEGGNYSSAQVNSEKLFSVIFSLLGQFEGVINNFIESILPDNVKCEIKFDKSTVLDKQTEIDNKYNQYLQTSIVSPYLEAVMDMPIKDIVKLREFEQNLGLEELFYPAQNAYTTSGNDAGRPAKKAGDIDNDNTAKSKGEGSNDVPSPSD